MVGPTHTNAALVHAFAMLIPPMSSNGSLKRSAISMNTPYSAMSKPPMRTMRVGLLRNARSYARAASGMVAIDTTQVSEIIQPRLNAS